MSGSTRATVPARSAPVASVPAARPRRDRFPREYAATRRFSLGEPRTMSVAGNGKWVVFLRSRSGTDPVTCLWAFDVAAGEERLVADPANLADHAEGDLPEEELRRRERTRESAEGITAYALDEAGDHACFAVAGQLFVVELGTGSVQALPATGAVFDPRLDPTGLRVAYVADRSLRVVGRFDEDRVLAGEDDPDLSWGVAEFVAAEEMGRSRGFWWSPNGQQLAVCRVDNRPVRRLYIADPANPQRPPTPHRYPAAGTDNASVELWVLGLDGSRVAIEWDRDAYPYLSSVLWQQDRPLTLVVQSRDQRRVEVLVADVVSGGTRCVRHDEDEPWIELFPGAPRWLGDALVTIVDHDGARRLEIDGEPVTPANCHVRAVVGTQGEDLLVTGSTDPTEVQLYRVSADGFSERLTVGPGVHGGTGAGEVLVLTSRTMDHFGTRVEVRVGGQRVGELANLRPSPR
ncbi:MAG: DPP IV N-terminal domain-containing protein [Acidimicrobiales bacterium]